MEMGQEFLRAVVEKVEFCRWVGVSMEGIGEGRGLGEGTGELLLKVGPFERGGLGGKRVILLRRLLLLILVVDEDCEGGVGSVLRRRRRRRRRRIEILGEMGVFLGEGGRGQRWGRVEIGRDAAAFCSDLYFRFFLMHYIRKDSSPKTQTLQFPHEPKKSKQQRKGGIQNSFQFQFLDFLDSFLSLSLLSSISIYK